MAESAADRAASSPVDPAAVPLAAYVHIPWCVAKCPYCDFNSHALRGAQPPADAYVDALLDDLRFELERCAERRPLVSVFFGGGTPSLMPPAAIGRILEALAAAPGLAAGAEITLEANPGTADAAHFAGYRSAGVNRLSIGVQSFDDGSLRALGRIHDGQAARRAVALARAAGFDNLNLDLMFALPGQDLRGALRDLDEAIALAPEHISWYQLTIEPNTAFWHAPPPLPDGDLAAEMSEQGGERLAAAGYGRYEVSAWARPGRRCVHNLNYWRFGDYLGIGAGAHGKRSGAFGIRRSAHCRHPREYLRARGARRLQQDVCVPDEDRIFEYLMNALRLCDGAPVPEFVARTGLPEAALHAALAPQRQRGLVEIRDGTVRATPLGYAHLNTVLAGLLDRQDRPTAGAGTARETSA